MKQLTPRPTSDKQQLARAGQALRPTPPPVRHDKASLLPAGRREAAAPRPVRSGPPLRTRFVINLESSVRYNLDELVLYEKCIHQTLAYRGRDGYRNSQDQDLHIRTSDVTTWNPGEVLAPMLKPLMHHFQNLWDEFADGEGPQNSAFLSEHPVTNDLKVAMQSETDRLIYLLYDKYQGNPEGAAQYVDMALSFGPIEAVTSLSNRNKTFAGSANMSGFVHGNRVIIVVADTKSLYSLLGHSTHRLDHFRSPRWYSYGFTYQFYVWSVRMHTHSWYMARRKTVDRHGRKKDWFGINPSLLPG